MEVVAVQQLFQVTERGIRAASFVMIEGVEGEGGDTAENNT